MRLWITATIAATVLGLSAPRILATPCNNKCSPSIGADDITCDGTPVARVCMLGGEGVGAKTCETCGVHIPQHNQPCANAATVPEKCCIDTPVNATCRYSKCIVTGGTPPDYEFSCAYTGDPCEGQDPFTYIDGSCDNCVESECPE